MGLDPNVNSDRFPETWDSFTSKTAPVINIRSDSEGANLNDTTTRGYFIGNTESFSVFSIGADCKIQLTADPDNCTWVNMTSGTVSSNTVIASNSDYPWVRVFVTAGDNPDVWLYRNYKNQ